MARTPPHDLDTSQLGSSQMRLVFVDVLRVALIVLVIAHHAGQAYGPTGGDWPIDDPSNMDWLGSFFAVNAAFFMGLLFLLAGYFVPRSYDRKGAGRFLKGRWQRIGLPLVFFALFVNLPLVYLADEESSSLGEFLRSSYRNGWQEVYIHLWFLGHLLLYSAVYVLWRRLRDQRYRDPLKAWPIPNHAALIGFVVALAVITWVVRIWYPIDEWIPLFYVLATEPAHLPQYVILFGFGIAAYRGDWLRKLPTATGAAWLAIGVAAAAAVYYLRAFEPSLWTEWFSTGGRTWESFVYSAWEALVCTGMCVGLIVLFREVFNRTNRVLAAMALASLAAYILHWLMVVGVQAGLEGLNWPGLAKFGFVTVVVSVLAFGIGHLSTRVPGFRVVLGTRPREPRPSDHEDAST